MLALDGELLARIAILLGKDEEASKISTRTDDHKAPVRTQFWDKERGVFANRLTNGHSVKALAPTAFFPLLAGIAPQDQAQALAKNYLTPEEKFGGRFSLPAASRDEPAFQHNTYWRGRVWGQLNYWVYQGFRRYGMFERRKIWPGKVRRCSPLSGNTDIVVKTTMRRQVKSPISRTPTAFIHGARFCRC